MLCELLDPTRVLKFREPVKSTMDDPGRQQHCHIRQSCLTLCCQRHHFQRLNHTTPKPYLTSDGRTGSLKALIITSQLFPEQCSLLSNSVKLSRRLRGIIPYKRTYIFECEKNFKGGIIVCAGERCDLGIPWSRDVLKNYIHTSKKQRHVQNE